MTTLLEQSKNLTFPTAEVEACIRDALAVQAGDQAILRPSMQPVSPLLPPSWEPEIDSLVVVDIICSVEELLGVNIPPAFSPRGGYDSADDCIKDLMSEAKAAWDDAVKEKRKNG